MVKIYPPPVAELVDRLRNFIEWEIWYRERMNLKSAGLRKYKIQEAENALVALEQLEDIAREATA